MSAAWEGIAAELLEAAGCEDPPVSALELADCCELTVRPARLLRARLCGDVIEVNALARSTRLHGLVAHEIGHWALQRAGEDDTEEGARYLVGALLLPRAAFDRDLRETEWNIEELRRRHPNASAEVIARRIVQLRDAVASIWDQGRCTTRVASSWLPVERVGRKTSTLERRLADRVLDTERTEHPAPLVWAVPAVDPGQRGQQIGAWYVDAALEARDGHHGDVGFTRGFLLGPALRGAQGEKALGDGLHGTTVARR